ncbi:hypothetical protein [Aquicella lusitana]|uniref:Uncharacterized protein n=1 Tax=Aquicella lusitana TaxID=254246 RepID=A0A370GIE6_9COXI|nr:hypothetical protein [Aquicella lusitana]RDI43431.1 hypothetical protein C8D86_11187 [Aquicella lusitana]VVC73581.1 hypothetical protein AQULUS_13240 [Aquicella lusitana]
MKRFEYSEYYDLTHDARLVDPGVENTVALLNQEAGRELVIEYYKSKYQSNMVEDEINGLIFGGEAIYEKIAQYVVPLLREAQKKAANTDNFRELFMIVSNYGKHITPILYIKENGRDAILAADTGFYDNKKVANYLRYALKTKSESLKEMPVLTIEEIRQSDDYSCFADCLVFGRDATGFVSHDQYIIPDLLHRLLERAETKEGYEDGVLVTKLPDELLKTAARAAFINAHQEHPVGRKIYKDKSLNEFHDKYTDKNILFKAKEVAKPTDVLAYARIKGIKLAELIEIQFYVDQFKAELGENFTSILEEDFRNRAKDEFKKQGINADNIRKGIHEIAEDFLAEVKNNLNRDRKIK